MRSRFELATSPLKIVVRKLEKSPAVKNILEASKSAQSSADVTVETPGGGKVKAVKRNHKAVGQAVGKTATAAEEIIQVDNGGRSGRKKLKRDADIFDDDELDSD